MNIDQQLVQQIVARVLDQIGTDPAPMRDESVDTTIPTAADTRTLLIEDKVVTGDVLAARLNGQQRIAFASNSILTPSAKDVLRQSGATWDRVSTGKSSAINLPWKAILLGSAPALTTAIDDTAGWSRELADSESEAVSSAISSVCRADSIGVCLFSTSPERVACRCNRNTQIRAAAVTDPNAVRRAQTDFGANVFCVNPKNCSYFEFKNTLRAVAAVNPISPKEWN